MEKIDVALKKRIHMYFMKTSVPRILADYKKPDAKKEAK